jgi:hypothetical protein
MTGADLVNQLLGTEVQLGRRINTTIYSREELETAVREKNSFVSRVLAQPKVWVTGNESDL